jgi:hypothetical protein
MPNITRMIKSRRMRWARHVACVGEIINEYRILFENLERMRLLGRPMHRWRDNIKIVLNEIE